MKRILAALYVHLFCHAKMRRINENIAKLGLKGLGLLSSHDDQRNNGELFFLKKVIQTYKIKSIFDVGANQGNYAKLCLDLGFDGNIYCFEPHPKTFEILTKTLKNTTAKFFSLGFSNAEGIATIYDHQESDGSEHASLYEEVIQSIHGHKAVQHEIVLTTIDAFVEKNKIEHIGLLKIDTEGNEFNILVGAEKTLRNAKIDVIHFEFNEMNIVSKAFVKNFLTILPNYTLYRLLPKGFLEITYEKPLLYELFTYQNIIAVRKGFNVPSGDLK